MILAILLVSLLAVSTVSAQDNATSDVVSVEETTSDIVKETTDDVVSVEKDQVILGNESNFGTFDELSSLIENTSEGATLELDKDYRHVSGSNNGITISKTITINGNNHMVDGGHLSNIFQITAHNVQLNNITFINGKQTDHGGAIDWYGDNGKLINSKFINCIAYPVAKNSCSWGGAIFWNGKYGSIVSCEFINNIAEGKTVGQGGAIYMYCINGSIINCTFTNNSAESGTNGLGGAIYWNEWSNGLLTNCTFNNNSAGYGSAVYVYYSDYLSIDNCKFLNNSAMSSAAVNIFYSDYNSIINCSFIGNSISDNCMISSIAYSTSNDFLVSDTLFNNNVGKITFFASYQDSTGKIINSYFYPELNITSLDIWDGVAIIKQTTCLNSTNIVFSYGNPVSFSTILKNNNLPLKNKLIKFKLLNDVNTIEYSCVTDYEGISTLCNELNDLTVGIWNITVTFEGDDNYAPCNATAIITVLPPSTSLTIDDVNTTWDQETTFTAKVMSDNKTINEGTVSFYIDDKFIGDAYVVNGTATLTHEAPGDAGNHVLSAMYNGINYLSSNGTAKMFVDTGDMEVEDYDSIATFKALVDLIENAPEGSVLNLTKNYIYVLGSNEGIQINKPITINGKGHTLNGNKLSRIFNVYANNVVLKDIILINACIKDNGGAIIWSGNDGLINSCNFVNCSNLINPRKDSYSGGAICLTGTNMNISYCNFTDNKAWDGASIAIYYSALNSYISCCNFINNFAQYRSGAISVHGDNHKFLNCNFINNTAENMAGVIEAYGDSIELKDCLFLNNSGDDTGAVMLDGYDNHIYGCNFTNNFAQYNGALYLAGAYDSYVVNCTFKDNYATGHCNALRITNCDNVHIDNCDFINTVGYYAPILLEVNEDIYLSYCSFYPEFGNIDLSGSGNVVKIKKNSYLIMNNYTVNYGDEVVGFALLKNYDNVAFFSNYTIIFELSNGDVKRSFYSTSYKEGVINFPNELSQLECGIWNVIVYFYGNDNYYPCNATATITVLPPSTSLTIDDVNATVGHEVTLIANVNSTLTVNEGIVTFFDGKNSIGESNVVDGVATLTYTPSTSGEHTITAIFSSGNYLSSNDTAKLLVDNATVEILINTGTVGYNSTFVANVKGLYSTINEGNVAFYINEEYLGQVPVVDGSASLVYTPLTAGDYTVRVVFSGSAKFLDDESSTVYTVKPVDSTVTINDVNGTVGHELMITVTVVSSNNLTINDGVVTFFDGSNQIGETGVYGGVASLTYTPSVAGEHTITAIFNSDNYLSSNSTAKLLVDSASINVLVDQGIVGFNSTFVAEVKGLYSIINEGTVAFYVNDEYLGNVPVVNGSASMVYVPLNVNTYTVKVVFGDSDKFLSDENSTSFTVVPSDTVIVIDDMDGTVGHELTITVEISSSNNLTVNEGYVVFFDGSNQIGEANVFDGIATLTYTPTTAGEHPITAMFYSTNYGDPINSALLNVSKADIDLSIDYIADVYFINPSNFAVNVLSNSKGVNEGIIEYYVDGKYVGMSYVYGGKTSTSFTTNTTGSFVLLVVYNETDNYFAKNASATFTVNKMPTTLSGESVIFDEEAYKTFTTELKDNNNNGVGDQPVKIEVIKYSGESATFNGISDANGITIYDVGRLAGGMWYVTGIYAGNNNYINSRFVDKFIVVRMNTTTEIEEIDNPKVNHNYKLKANIHDENGKLVKEGIVQFYLDGVDIGSIDLSKNQGHQNALGEGVLGAVNPMFEFIVGADDVSDLYINYVPTKAGKHTLTAVYEGTTIYKASNSTTSFDVSNSNTLETDITASSVTTVYNGGKYIVIKLKDVNGKAVNGVKVTVVLGGKTFTPTTKNGQAKVSTNGLAPVKTYKATITFKGNSKYDKSTTTAKVTVKKATPKLTAKAKTFKKSVKTKNYVVTLKTNQNKVMKKTKVTLKVNGKTYSATTNSKGKATFKITKLTKKGVFTAVVKFAGNKYYNAKTVKPKIIVK